MAIKSSFSDKKLAKILGKLVFVCFAMFLLCVIILFIALFFFQGGNIVEILSFVLEGIIAFLGVIGLASLVWLLTICKRMKQDYFSSIPSRVCANIECGSTTGKSIFCEKKELILNQPDFKSQCEVCGLPSPMEFSNSIFEKYYKPFYATIDGMAALATCVDLWGTLYQINHPFDAAIKNEYKEKQFTSQRDEAILTKYPWLVSLKIFR